MKQKTRLYFLKNHPLLLFLSLAFGLSVGFLVYSTHLQLPLMSKRNIAIGLGLSILSSLVFLFIYTEWAYSAIQKLNKRRIAIFLIAAILLATSFLFVADITPRSLYFLQPETDLVIEIDGADCQGVCDDVQLLYLRNDFRDISFSELEISGNPKVSDDSLSFSADESALIKWSGIAGEELSVTFSSTNASQTIRVHVNGEEQIVNLQKKELDEVTVQFAQTEKDNSKIIFTIALFNLLVFIFMFFLIGFSSNRPYFFIFLGIWLFTLLIYWPGIIGEVNPQQIQDLVAGELNDWHPVTYTLLLFFSDRILFSISAFIIIQIIAASFVLAWAFSSFEDLGASRKALILLSFISALLPSNLLSLLTMTNDIPFSIAMAALQVVLFKIFWSRGEWLHKTNNVILFIIISLTIILFRYNGLPALVATFGALFIFFWSKWKRILLSLVTVIAIYGILNGPVFDLIGVKHVASGHFDNILLHHISAHVDAGTPTSADDREYLNSLLPLEKWEYRCCSNQTMLFKPDFDLERFHANSEINQRVAINFATKNPKVDLRHMLCASDIVWNIAERCERSIPSIQKVKGLFYWTKNSNPQYFEDSKLPFLVSPISRMILSFESTPPLYHLVWRPALYLYISFVLTIWFISKFRSIKVLTLLAPILGQSVFLFLFNRVQIFRYQYCVILMTLIIIGISAVPKAKHRESKSSER